MPRAQFSLKTLLWVVAVMAAFLAGRTIGIEGERRRLHAEMSLMRAWVERERTSVSENPREWEASLRRLRKLSARKGSQNRNRATNSPARFPRTAPEYI